MLIADLLIAGITVAIAVRGYSRGVTSGGLLLLGAAAGALLGSRLTPLVLKGGLHDPLAPLLALPGAVLFGALGAMLAERFSFGTLRRLRDRPRLDGLSGGLLAAALCLVAVWLIGAVVASFDSLKDTVRDSAVAAELNAVLPPPGPLLNPVERRDPLPLLVGPRPGVRAASTAIKHDPQVRAAAPSVVKMAGHACGRGMQGSGWIAADGVVVTNAHVVEGSDDTKVQVQGTGPLHDALPIWFDEVNDLAIFRVPGVRGMPPLPIDVDARPGTSAAVLGFPGGGAYTVKPARLGNTWRIPGFRLEGRARAKRQVTSFLARVRPGNSGGPVVDGNRRVVTVVFGGRQGGHGSYGVPMPIVERALRRAGPPVDTGPCPS